MRRSLLVPCCRFLCPSRAGSQNCQHPNQTTRPGGSAYPSVSDSWGFFFFNFIFILILSIFRERGRHLARAVSALIRDRTGSLSVYRPALSPLSHTSQGKGQSFC